MIALAVVLFLVDVVLSVLLIIEMQHCNSARSRRDAAIAERDSARSRRDAAIAERDQFRDQRDEANRTLLQIAEDACKWEVYLGESPYKLTRLAANVAANKMLVQMSKDERKQVVGQALENSKNFTCLRPPFTIVTPKRLKKLKASKKK